MLMQSPQFGFPSVSRFVFLWLLQTLSLTSSTKGEDRDHSDPVIAFEGQYCTHSTQSPHRLCSMGASGSSGASVNTVTKDSRGPKSGLIRSPFFPTQPMPHDVAAILWLNRE
jgi:hypothetical protein